MQTVAFCITIQPRLSCLLHSLPMRPSLCPPHSPYRRLDLSSSHQVDSALLILPCQKNLLIMQMDTERQSSLETNKQLCALGKQNHCILFWKTLQRMLTAFWFCHRETEQKQIVTDLHSHVYLPFILNNDTLTYSTPFTLTFSPLLPHLLFYYGGPELPKSKIKK